MLVEVGDHRPDGILDQCGLIHGIDVFLADAFHDLGKQFDLIDGLPGLLVTVLPAVHQLETEKRCKAQRGPQHNWRKPVKIQ